MGRLSQFLCPISKEKSRISFWDLGKGDFDGGGGMDGGHGAVVWGRDGDNLQQGKKATKH